MEVEVRVGYGRKKSTHSDVTQTSTPAISISSSSCSRSSSFSAALWPLSATDDVPLALLRAPFARPESAGAAARSEAWSKRVAEGE